MGDNLPLREPTFFILLSLRTGSKHGYAILKDVEELSQGRILLSAGTLYEALARLLDQGLIDRLDESPDIEGKGHPGKPRKTYQLTQQGSFALESEVSRLKSIIAAVNQRLNEQG
jgi:PadR family transcriptional regulator, regulatory protein PadR